MTYLFMDERKNFTGILIAVLVLHTVMLYKHIDPTFSSSDIKPIEKIIKISLKLDGKISIEDD